MEVPEYDAFTLPIAVFYLLGFGLAFLVRTDRTWAWWLTLVVAIVLVMIGPLWYYPVTAALRQNDPLYWWEGVAYLGFLFITVFLAIQRLRGATLTTG